jgi:hypothetical protein|tara:strand:+ start:190 stop:510 length:321 start_codon:yes stop_codon:yes gene_type:complete
MPKKKAVKKNFSLTDTITAVGDVFTVIKANKSLLTDLIMHPIETVKKDIHLMLASGLFLAMGMFFLLFAVAQYLVENSILSLTSAYGLMGVILVVLGFLMQVVRKR